MMLFTSDALLLLKEIHSLFRQWCRVIFRAADTPGGRVPIKAEACA
jgi:hypothetical protein